jgi:hypothetical protein
MVDFAWLSGLFSLDVLRNITKVVYCHDLISLRVRTFLDAGIEPDLPLWSFEEEIEILGKADYLILETADEVRRVQDSLPKVKVLNVPRAQQVRGVAQPQAHNRLIFVGGGARHNVTGLDWFLSGAYPRILENLPNVQLDVFGVVCDAFAHRRFPNVRFNGRTDDLSPGYLNAKCVIVPLLAGTGFKTKLSEALAYGRACVATTAGAWGAESLNGHAILIEDDASKFADATLKVLRDNELRRKMEAAATSFTRDKLNPEVVFRPIDAMLFGAGAQLHNARE